MECTTLRHSNGATRYCDYKLNEGQTKSDTCPNGTGLYDLFIISSYTKYRKKEKEKKRQ